LKQIRPDCADDPRQRSRFQQEAELTARLEHPGVVPLYGLGNLPDGRPFYAMRLVRGETLKEAIRGLHEAGPRVRYAGEGSVPWRGWLGGLVSVCQRVPSAPGRGGLPGALKRPNALPGESGEPLVIAGGRAKPMDRPEAPGGAGGSVAPRPPAGGGPGGTQ